MTIVLFIFLSFREETYDLKKCTMFLVELSKVSILISAVKGFCDRLEICVLYSKEIVKEELV